MRRSVLFPLPLSLALTACGEAVDPVVSRTIDLSLPWEEVALDQSGANEQLVRDGIALGRKNHRLTGLLVVHDGRLVVEEYFRDNHRDSLNDVRSVTKSVVSILTGIAIEQRFLSGVDETMALRLDPGVATVTPDKHDISVLDLLNMTGGFSWNETTGNQYSEWILSPDHVEYVLQRPMAAAPGSTFTYNSGAVHLLGVVLEQATGMTLPAFAEQYLFSPLGITDVRWESLSRGFVNGGSGVDLRLRDLARLGQLLLQRGRSGTRQVVSPAWVDQMTQPQHGFRLTAAGELPDVTYGLLWWVRETPAEAAYFAWGFGGQFIYVVPERQLVVVATNEWRGMSSEGGPIPFEAATLELIRRYIVPAW